MTFVIGFQRVESRRSYPTSLSCFFWDTEDLGLFLLPATLKKKIDYQPVFSYHALIYAIIQPITSSVSPDNSCKLLN